MAAAAPVGPPQTPRRARHLTAWHDSPEPPVPAVEWTTHTALPVATSAVVAVRPRLCRVHYRLHVHRDGTLLRVEIRRLSLATTGEALPPRLVTDAGWDRLRGTVAGAAHEAAPYTWRDHEGELRWPGLCRPCPECKGTGALTEEVETRAGCAPTDPPLPSERPVDCPECQHGVQYTDEFECVLCAEVVRAAAVGCLYCWAAEPDEPVCAGCLGDAGHECGCPLYREAP